MTIEIHDFKGYFIFFVVFLLLNFLFVTLTEVSVIRASLIGFFSTLESVKSIIITMHLSSNLGCVQIGRKAAKLQVGYFVTLAE